MRSVLLWVAGSAVVAAALSLLLIMVLRPGPPAIETPTETGLATGAGEPVGTRPAAIAIAPDGKRLYVGAEGGLVVEDTATGTLIGTVGFGQSLREIVLDVPGKRVVTSTLDGIVVVDLMTNLISDPIPLPQDLSVISDLVGVTADGNTLVAISSGQESQLIRVDLTARTVAPVLAVGAGTTAFAFDPATGAVYLGASNGPAQRVEVATGAVTPIAGSENASTLALSADGRILHGVGSGGRVEIDTATLAVTKTVERAPSANALEVSPTGGHLFAIGYDGDVAVLDTATDSVVETLRVGEYSEGVALSPDGTRLYIVAANGLTTFDVGKYR